MSFIGNGHKAWPHRAANEFYKVLGETASHVYCMENIPATDIQDNFSKLGKMHILLLSSSIKPHS